MKRPPFVLAWNASMQIYDPLDSATKVATVIGGNVAKNINNQDIKRKWRNTCAVRMSYILNKSGMRLPRVLGKTVSGADRCWYFFRVEDLIGFLKKHWGNPDEIVKYPPPGGGILANRRGVILFKVSGWIDAAGHATLWDGTICYDHCYYNEPDAHYQTDNAYFWSLP